MGDDLVRVVGLHKHYGDLHVLRGVDLEVRRGEVVVLIGPSGSGKSSLLRCLNRLETPSQGHIFINGVDITRPGINLPTVRRDAFGTLAPDLGPDAPDPHLGATAVGSRPPLIAVNVELATTDVEIARRIARETRERDGGLLGVRAMGLPLASRGTVQVSMNLVDLAATGIERACTEVRDRARVWEVAVTRVELVGLLPAAELARCSDAFRTWTGLTPNDTVEARVGN